MSTRVCSAYSLQNRNSTLFGATARTDQTIRGLHVTSSNMFSPDFFNQMKFWPLQPIDTVLYVENRLLDQVLERNSTVHYTHESAGAQFGAVKTRIPLPLQGD